MHLTLADLAGRVRLALHLYLAEYDAGFERVVSDLTGDLIQSIALGRCEAPQEACRILSTLFCLNADEQTPQ